MPGPCRTATGLSSTLLNSMTTALIRIMRMANIRQSIQIRIGLGRKDAEWLRGNSYKPQHGSRQRG